MSETGLPKCCAKEPRAIDLKAGETYSWCTCGLSKKEEGALCDGSHKNPVPTGFSSLKYTAEKDETVYFCMCKQTKNPPFCDGSHSKL